MNKDKKLKKQVDKRKEYNSKKRRILILVLLVLFLIGVLGFSTMAWFSSNKHGVIDSIDINVATVTGLQISADAIEWGNEVTKDQIINAYKTYPAAENQLPDTLSNVSTAGNVTNGKLDMYYGVTSEEKDGGFTLTTLEQTEMQCTGGEECGDKHYIAFDVFLLVTTPATIALTGNSNVIPQPDTRDKGSQNAARVAFVIEGTVNSGSSAAAQALKGGTSSLIWEPNYDVHTPEGVEAAKNVYGVTTSLSGASRIPYKGVNRAFQTPVYIDQTDKSSYFTTVNPRVATVKNFVENQQLMNIPAGITKVRIYMWLEGQDVDMDNSVAASQLLYNVEFAMIN